MKLIHACSAIRPDPVYCHRGDLSRRRGAYAQGLLLSVFTLLLAVSVDALAARCLYISSYHKGYAWSDGVERGLRSVLSGRCELKQFDMDTKRNKDTAYKERIALEAKTLIESWKPDVVITADDNAAKYIIQPYFKDHVIPFVFCGINWSVEEYGFPYRNTTGMVEIAPIEPLFDKVRNLSRAAKRGFYIGANTLTEGKNLDRFQRAAAKRNVHLDHRLANSTDEWLQAYRHAQDYDFVVIGSKSGINDWQPERVIAEIKTDTRRLSLTNHGWMMPYTILGLTKVPEEHGEWAGNAATYILEGTNPSDIPIIPNRKWDIWVNPGLLEVSGVELPEKLFQKAKKVR